MNVVSQLLLDLSSRYGGEGSTIVLGGEAALANNIEGNVFYAPTDIRELDAATVPTSPNSSMASTVLVPAPPDRDLLRRQLIVASRNVRANGRVFVCGANSAGGKTAVKDATDLFGDPWWSGYREKHRMAIFEVGELFEPSWINEPGIAPDTWRDFTAVTSIGNIPLQTQAGVFAGARLDIGTRLLLENLHIHAGSHVLDVGCGVGMIGIFAAMQGAKVTMTDANLLAVNTAIHNIQRLNIDAHAIASDVYRHLEEEESFDLIVSNPPFHRGKEVDFSVANEIISGAAQRLNPGGSLILVANAFLTYGKQMQKVFTRVDTIASTPQYHVLKGST